MDAKEGGNEEGRVHCGPFQKWLTDVLVFTFSYSVDEALSLTEEFVSEDVSDADVEAFCELIRGPKDQVDHLRKALLQKLFPDGLARNRRSTAKVKVSLQHLYRNQGQITPSAMKTGKRRPEKKHSLLSWNPFDIDLQNRDREECDCQGRRHDFLGSCRNCGRIVCAREKLGPCFFCGEEVTAHDHIPEDLHLNLAFADALRRRNVLLSNETDPKSNSRVVDDESDYFSVQASSWKTAEEKKAKKIEQEHLDHEKELARNFRFINIDLTSGFLSTDCRSEDAFEEIDQQQQSERSAGGASSFYQPQTSLPKPRSPESLRATKNSLLLADSSKVLEFADLLEMEIVAQRNEENMVLSMHQPWASLLIHDVKYVEGRSWSTAYRGWMWIASTASVADNYEVDAILSTYRELRGSSAVDSLDFPTSRLLGCVFLVDVLTREQYRESVADPALFESDCPFVWVFRHDRLIIQDPPKIMGHPKLWTLSCLMLRSLLENSKVLQNHCAGGT
eukprot:ANDGO_05266.mRNA.1 hypothetical protein